MTKLYTQKRIAANCLVLFLINAAFFMLGTYGNSIATFSWEALLCWTAFFTCGRAVLDADNLETSSRKAIETRLLWLSFAGSLVSTALLFALLRLALGLPAETKSFPVMSVVRLLDPLIYAVIVRLTFKNTELSIEIKRMLNKNTLFVALAVIGWQFISSQLRMLVDSGRAAAFWSELVFIRWFADSCVLVACLMFASYVMTEREKGLNDASGLAKAES